ncbi:MAG: DUF933 domain-containing protein [Myxococcales bacterium]|nr:MAG: DUF933 domain-containing protein [Myxococcales bacterium]
MAHPTCASGVEAADGIHSDIARRFFGAGDISCDEYIDRGRVGGRKQAGRLEMQCETGW